MSDTASGRELLQRVPAALALVRTARERGLSLVGAWLVGGAVRDAALERADSDIDLDVAVEGDAHAFAQLLASATAGEVVAEHAFGTATVRVPLEGFPVLRIDVAGCRTERYREPGALPDVELGATIGDDLARRDATCNAVAIALEPGDDGEHAVADPHGGLADIESRLLRVLHDASFADDPTRLFRVARYAGRLGFAVEDHTRSLAIAAAESGALATVSAERVRTELELQLREPAWAALTLLSGWGVLARLEPRLEAAFRPPLLLPLIDRACGDDRERNAVAWTLRLASLANVLGDDAVGWLRWLGFPGGVVERVVDHLRVLAPVVERPDELRGLSNSQLYLQLGEVADDSIALGVLVTDHDPALQERLVDYRRALRETRLAVRGEDVMAAGVPMGTEVGRVLGELFLRSLDGELRGEDDERRALEQLARVRGDGGDGGDGGDDGEPRVQEGAS